MKNDFEEMNNIIYDAEVEELETEIDLEWWAKKAREIRDMQKASDQ